MTTRSLVQTAHLEHTIERYYYDGIGRSDFPLGTLTLAFGRCDK